MRKTFFIFVFLFLNALDVFANPTKVLFEAIEAVDHEAIKLALSRGANVKATNEHGETVLHVCARVGDAIPMSEFVELGAFVNARDALKQTPLHVACAYGNEQEVRTLILLKADPLLVDIEGRTALEFAAQNKEWGIIELVSSYVEESKNRPAIVTNGIRIPGIVFPIGMVLAVGLASYCNSGRE